MNEGIRWKPERLNTSKYPLLGTICPLIRFTHLPIIILRGFTFTSVFSYQLLTEKSHAHTSHEQFTGPDILLHIAKTQNACLPCKHTSPTNYTIQEEADQVTKCYFHLYPHLPTSSAKRHRGAGSEEQYDSITENLTDSSPSH